MLFAGIGVGLQAESPRMVSASSCCCVASGGSEEMSPAAMIDSKLSFSVAGSADIAMREARVIVVTESCGKVHARHEDIRMEPASILDSVRLPV